MKNTILALVLIVCLASFASASYPSTGRCYWWKRCSRWRRCGYGKYCDYRYGKSGVCCSRYGHHGGHGGYGYDNYGYGDRY